MKILLADDHTLFRDIIVQYIARSHENAQIITAKSFSEGKQQLEQNQSFDLVILDLKMPGMNGLDGLKELIAIYSHIPFAIMSGVAEPDMISEALAIGAAGYFPKTLSGHDLLLGIETVLNGEKYIPMDEKSAGLMPSHFADHSDCGVTKRKDVKTTNDIRLTPREKEVLGYLVQGLSNKEIANDLGVQLVTIKLHVRGICRKLGADNRTQAALRAKELRLLS